MRFWNLIVATFIFIQACGPGSPTAPNLPAAPIDANQKKSAKVPSLEPKLTPALLNLSLPDTIPGVAKHANALLQSLKSDQSLSEINPDLVALALFESHLADVPAPVSVPNQPVKKKATPEEMLTALKSLTLGLENESNPWKFKVALETKLEEKLKKKILYNKVSTLLYTVMKRGTLMCSSGTDFFLMAYWLTHPEALEKNHLVALYQPAHVLPASIYWNGFEWSIKGIETTASGLGTKDYGPFRKYNALDEDYRLIDARESLISEALKDYRIGPKHDASNQVAIDELLKRFLIPSYKKQTLDLFNPAKNGNGLIAKNVGPFNIASKIDIPDGDRPRTQIRYQKLYADDPVESQESTPTVNSGGNASVGFYVGSPTSMIWRRTDLNLMGIYGVLVDQGSELGPVTVDDLRNSCVTNTFARGVFFVPPKSFALESFSTFHFGTLRVHFGTLRVEDIQDSMNEIQAQIKSMRMEGLIPMDRAICIVE